MLEDSHNQHLMERALECFPIAERCGQQCLHYMNDWEDGLIARMMARSYATSAFSLAVMADKYLYCIESQIPFIKQTRLYNER